MPMDLYTFVRGTSDPCEVRLMEISALIGDVLVGLRGDVGGGGGGV
jgi:hypothetical protein